MNTKTKTLALISVIVLAVVAGAFILTMESTVKADTTTNSVASDSEITPSSVNTTDNGPIDFNGHMMMGIEPRFGMGHRGMGRGGFGGFGMGAVQISSDFTANVTNIAKSDSDVQNLLSQGYNITLIRPVITTTIDGNGNIVTKASSADVMLQGTNGRAFVVVDLTQAKVTKIVTLTVTEINK